MDNTKSSVKIILSVMDMDKLIVSMLAFWMVSCDMRYGYGQAYRVHAGLLDG